MNSLSEHQYQLTDLFHYDPESKKCADLQKGIKEYRLLLKLALEASKEFENGNLEKFDALVGENACQIRAVCLALIEKRKSIDFSALRQRIKNSIDQINSLFTSSRIASLMSNKVSLRETINHYQLEIFLNFDELFIIQSYILFLVKEKRSIEKFPFFFEKTNPNNIKRVDIEVSSQFRDKLVTKIRILLSKCSVEYVRKIAVSLEDEFLVKMVGDDFIFKHNELFCMPIFWATKILLKEVQARGLPLVIHIKFIKNQSEKYVLNDEEVLLYRPNKNDSNNYSETEVFEADLEETACFFQGIACALENQQPLSKEEWKRSIGQYSILDIILANIAYHRQYPNPDKEVSILDQEYENYKDLAKNCGFSIDNPTLLFFQHIYAAKIKTSPKLFERAIKDKSER